MIFTIILYFLKMMSNDDAVVIYTSMMLLIEIHSVCIHLLENDVGNESRNDFVRVIRLKVFVC
jgi:hypothetical protein